MIVPIPRALRAGAVVPLVRVSVRSVIVPVAVIVVRVNASTFGLTGSTVIMVMPVWARTVRIVAAHIELI